MRIRGGTLVDTNLLLRFAEPAHAMHLVAMNALDAMRQYGEDVYICPQNLVEFWVVATRPASANGLGMTTRQAEAELARMEFLFPVLPDTASIYSFWRRLVTQAGVGGKATHDARLMAVAQAHGVPRLLTFNVTDFTRFAAAAPAVEIVDPALT